MQSVASERFQRNDTSVNGQIRKIMAAKPNAVLIGGANPSVIESYPGLGRKQY